MAKHTAGTRRSPYVFLSPPRQYLLFLGDLSSVVLLASFCIDPFSSNAFWK
jgi:hypothetical protein